MLSRWRIHEMRQPDAHLRAACSCCFHPVCIEKCEPKQHLTFVHKHNGKSFWRCPPAGSCRIRFRMLQDAERTAVRDGSASRTERRMKCVSTIRGAPQLGDSTEWALPHLSLQSFLSHPPPLVPPLCLRAMGTGAPVGQGCSLRVHLPTPWGTHPVCIPSHQKLEQLVV